MIQFTVFLNGRCINASYVSSQTAQNTIFGISYRINFTKQIYIPMNLKSSCVCLYVCVCLLVYIYVNIFKSMMNTRRISALLATSSRLRLVLGTLAIMTILVFKFAHSFYFHLIAIRELVSPKHFCCYFMSMSILFVSYIIVSLNSACDTVQSNAIIVRARN